MAASLSAVTGAGLGFYSTMGIDSGVKSAIGVCLSGKEQGTGDGMLRVDVGEYWCGCLLSFMIYHEFNIATMHAVRRACSLSRFGLFKMVPCMRHPCVPVYVASQGSSIVIVDAWLLVAV